MNLNETMNSDYKNNELLNEDYESEDDMKGKQHDEESKYGMVVSVANDYRSQQVQR